MEWRSPRLQFLQLFFGQRLNILAKWICRTVTPHPATIFECWLGQTVVGLARLTSSSLVLNLFITAEMCLFQQMLYHPCVFQEVFWKIIGIWWWHKWRCYLHAYVLSVPLTEIFNDSFRGKYFPKIWKEYKLKGIPKSTPCSTVDNLRPIALTSVLSKIQESFVVDQLDEWRYTWQNLGVTVWGYSKFVNIFGLITTGLSWIVNTD
jgi:hypothetical protein